MPGRDFFNNHILNTNALGLENKRKLFLEMVKELKFMDGKEFANLDKLIADLIKMRNAFAHGKIMALSDSDPSISFFSGTPRNILLTEQFWSDLERDFTELDKIINVIKTNLLKKFLKE